MLDLLYLALGVGVFALFGAYALGLTSGRCNTRMSLFGPYR